MNLNQVTNPVYALILIAFVAGLAWGLGRLIPFYRRELAAEDQTRLTPLDGLRGILCFAVMCHHVVVAYGYVDTGRWMDPPSNFYRLLGNTPVALFFCVTAFLFWSRAVACQGKIEPRPFLQARFFRLVPLYIFSCLLALALAAKYIRWLSPTTLTGLASMASLGLHRWTAVGGVNMFYVSSGVTWTLAYEWGFYLALPALALLARDPRDARRLPLIALAFFALFEPSPAFFFLPGVLAVYAARHEPLATRLRGAPAALMVLAAAAVFPWLTNYGFGHLGLALTTLIFVPIACGNSLFGLLNLRGLRLMGLVSYSVYLLHGLCLFAARDLLLNAKSDPDGGAVWYWYYATACAAVVLVVSLLTYRWIEWPFIQLDRRLRHGPRTAELAAEAVAPVTPVAPPANWPLAPETAPGH